MATAVIKSEPNSTSSSNPAVTALFTHLRPHPIKPSTSSNPSEVKFVQLVLESSNNNNPGSIPLLTAAPLSAVSSSSSSTSLPVPKAKSKSPSPPSSSIDENCTICGQQFISRSSFNAHIKIHLKEKLKRNQEKLNNSPVHSPKPPKRKRIECTPPPPPPPPQLLPPKLCNSDLMAELAACQPVPPESMPDIIIPPNPLTMPPTPASSSIASPSKCPTAEISDMEDDIMSYEMEMNRIDFNNDISSILDQIEKDFESPGGFQDIRLDTPPDSDSENNSTTSENNGLLNGLDELPANPSGIDLLGFDKFTRRISLQQATMLAVPPRLPEGGIQENKLDLDQLISDTIKSKEIHINQLPKPLLPPISQPALVQSASSIAKVGQLPAKALAVLNQLPSKLFLPKSDAGGPRLVNVVKVERSGSIGTISNGIPPSSGPFTTVINIECQNSKNSKIIETYRAIDTGSELKLVSSSPAVQDIIIKTKDHASKTTNNTSATPTLTADNVITTNSTTTISTPISSPPNNNNNNNNNNNRPIKTSKTCSECTVCGKTITTKNMARHMEKHTGKKKFQCDICNASFYQKTHLKNHVALHQQNNESGFECQDCHHKFNRKIEFIKHMKLAHNNDVSSSSDSSAEDGATDSFNCALCPKIFAQKGHLNRHMRGSHNINNNNKNDDLICIVCDKQCKNKISLIRHRTKHLICIHCNDQQRPLVFENKIALQEHLLKVHPNTAIMSIEKMTPSSPPPLDQFDFLTTTSEDVTLTSSIKTEIKTEDDAFLTPSPPSLPGGSLADISNANFFDFSDSLPDDLYSTDLF